MQPQINLLPHRAQARVAQRARLHRSMGVAALLAVGVAALLHVFLHLQTERERADHQMLQAAIAGLDAQILAGAAQRADLARQGERQRALEALQTERNLPVQLLGELALRVPEGVQLTRLTQAGQPGPQQVVLQGHALSSEQVHGMLRQLDGSSPRGGWRMRAELVEMAAAPLLQRAQGPMPAVSFTVRVGLLSPDLQETPAMPQVEVKQALPASGPGSP